MEENYNYIMESSALKIIIQRHEKWVLTLNYKNGASLILVLVLNCFIHVKKNYDIIFKQSIE